MKLSSMMLIYVLGRLFSCAPFIFHTINISGKHSQQLFECSIRGFGVVGLSHKFVGALGFLLCVSHGVNKPATFSRFFYAVLKNAFIIIFELF